MMEMEILQEKIEKLEAELKIYKTLYPPGHYYSSIPSLDNIRKRRVEIFSVKGKEIPGLNLREKEQLELLEKIKFFYGELPYTDNKNENFRYYYLNDYYSYSDAIFLFSVIRYFKPKRVIEVGSGFSSALMLDTNDLFFNGNIECTFIEPYPDRLLKLLRGNEKVNLIQQGLQDVELKVFHQLEANDILFIDSTHVGKTGSDVNQIIFEVLPSLSEGVFVHVHDIFFPFEYPEDWVFMGRTWNETYMLRAFLQYNSSFEVLLFNTFLEHYHEPWFASNMPLCLRNRGGSIWLKKIK